MKWEILILTQPSRVEFLRRLLAQLEPQVAGHDVAVRLRTFDPHLTLGENRQAMVDASRAEYVSFVDDDDLVAPDYVEKILPLLDGVDYVGFQLQCYTDGRPERPTFHSLRYRGWSQDDAGYYRDISHVNPIRRVVALRSRMEGGFGEDCRWAGRLREIGCVRTEHYVNEVMYLYYYRSNKIDAVGAR